MSHIVRILPPPIEAKIVPTSKDWADLERAVELLESPTLTAKMANLIGSPLEFAVKKLPQSVSKRIHGAVEAALFKSAQAALWSMDNTPGKEASTRWHKAAAAATGALGGAFGFTALFLELPVSTTIMMRSVADVARSEGFDLSEMGTRHACLEVFALGGNSGQDDASETGYYITRGFTAEVMRHLSAELAGAAVGGGGVMIGLTPKEAGKWLAKIVEKVAARFGVVVTEKFAAQAVPIIGAVAGATLNTMFTDYYQDMARGHFIVRRLERQYGYETVRSAYNLLAGQRDAGKA
ncbi:MULTISPECIES: EcsC family protein [Stenotrophomonas]|uniref:EcsC family protein n=1 Tax=Stenotrophomonas TaxID=40323 RepID=UPI0008732293|nr:MULTISPECIES: EcsC family protein [Stenotrophomonas]OEZ02380.1 peptidase [Stenotrophomonas sp. BIIR7]